MSKTFLSKITLLLVISVVLNVLLGMYIALGFFAASQISNFAQYNAIHDKLCEQDYQKTLDDYARQFADDPQRANDSKMSFALNVCHRNYKTGEPLDLQPLVDQVKR